jgi:hypothetical protein
MDISGQCVQVPELWEQKKQRHFVGTCLNWHHLILGANRRHAVSFAQ